MMPEERVKDTQTIPHSAPPSQVPLAKIADRLEVANASLKGRHGKQDKGLEKNRDQLVQQISELDLLTQYHNTVLANISQGILVVDTDGNVTTYNKAAEKTLGIPAVEVLFQSFWKNFSDNVLGFSLRQTLKEMKSPYPTSAKVENEKDGDKEIEVEASIVQISEMNTNNEDQEGSSPSMNGLIVLILDVTEHKHHEVIAQRKHRMNELGEMAAMVAHEIRNPLGGIKGFASLLERDLVDRPDLKKMASYIIDGTNNLNDLVTRVLNYSRPITTHFEAVDLISLVQKIRVEVLRDDAYSKNINIEILSNEDPIIATIDPQSMRSTIFNLIENAIQAMPDGGGNITINIEKDERHILIKVTDTGVGIPQENFKKLFSPFFTTRPDGNGFGLSEVHKIIQLHGGKVEVESQVGVGSTFILKIPLSKVGVMESKTSQKVEESL